MLTLLDIAVFPAVHAALEVSWQLTTSLLTGA
jgi:hypothetical protein